MSHQHTAAVSGGLRFKKVATNLVLLILASGMDEQDECRWPIAQLIHYTHLHKTTVIAALNEIETAGVISRHKQGRRKFYRWNWDAASVACSKETR